MGVFGKDHHPALVEAAPGGTVEDLALSTTSSSTKKPGGPPPYSGEEILVYDVAGRTCVAQLLDGSVDVSWIKPDLQAERMRDGVARLCAGVRG